MKLNDEDKYAFLNKDEPSWHTSLWLLFAAFVGGVAAGVIFGLALCAR